MDGRGGYQRIGQTKGRAVSSKLRRLPGYLARQFHDLGTRFLEESLDFASSADTYRRDQDLAVDTGRK
jgi:hypothetical protein